MNKYLVLPVFVRYSKTMKYANEYVVSNVVEIFLSETTGFH